MKALVMALGLWGAASWAQSAPPDLRIESRAPSLKIAFAGQDGPAYKFRLENFAAHAVIGYAIVAAPAGVERAQGKLLCQGQCSETVALRDRARPVINADGSVEVTYDAASLAGGAIIVRAALFDDESYEGSERSAAYLVARQIGNQAEYDRIVPLVGAIVVSSALPENAKAERILLKVDDTPVAVTPALVQRFKRQFPDLHDCDHRYARAIKSAAATERRYVEERVRAFISGQYPAGTSLRAWWAQTQDYLDGLGCSGCAAMPVHAQSSRSAHRPFRGCNAKAVPAAADDAGNEPTDEAADDEIADDLIPQDASGNEAELGPQDDPGPEDMPDDADANAPSPTSAQPAPLLKPAPDLSSVTAPAVVYPFPNVDGFKAFFSSVASYRSLSAEQGFSSVGANWQQSSAGLTEQEGELVGQVADSCGQLRDKLFAAISAFQVKYSGLEFLWVPWPPEFGQIEREEEKFTAARVRLLRKQLGESSFKKLDSYVAAHYTFPLPPVVRAPRSDQLYWFYFHYVADLEQFALRDRPEDLKQGPLRVREQRKAGLNHGQWEALVQMAKRYEQAVKEQLGLVRVSLPGGMPGGPPANQPALQMARPAASMQASGTQPTGVQPAVPAALPNAQPALAPQPTLAAQPAASAPPSGTQTPPNVPTLIGPPTPGVALAPAKEWNEKRDRLTAAYVKQLKLKLGPAAFKTLDSYVQRSYYLFIPARPADKAAKPVARMRSASKSKTQ